MTKEVRDNLILMITQQQKNADHGIKCAQNMHSEMGAMFEGILTHCKSSYLAILLLLKEAQEKEIAFSNANPHIIPHD